MSNQPSSPIRDSGYSVSTDTSISTSRTTLAGDIVIDVLGVRFTSTYINYGCSQTSGYRLTSSRTGSGYRIATGSTTSSCYNHDGGDASLASISIKKAPLPTATPTSTPTKTPTVTNTPSATNTPTSTNVTYATATPNLTPTETPTATATPINDPVWRYYYYSGNSRVAMRIRVEAAVVTDEVYFLISDHLGSTSLVVNMTGTLVNEQRYKPWGETRFSSGSSLTDYQYTGQRSQVSETGLYYYNARWYDPLLGRFVQADTIIPEPGNQLAWDRYAYSRNDPINFSDPTGHITCSDDGYCGSLSDQAYQNYIRQQQWISSLRNRWGEDFPWDEIPSTYGFVIGGNVQFGVVAEPGAFTEGYYLVNYNSGEISFGYTSGSFLYTGMPNLAGISAYAGPISYENLSQIKNIAGPAEFAGGIVGGDMIGKFSVSQYAGEAINNGTNIFNPIPYLDSFSKKPVTYNETNFSIGGNVIPNAVDVGGIVGISETTVSWTFELPFYEEVRPLYIEALKFLKFIGIIY